MNCMICNNSDLKIIKDKLRDSVSVKVVWCDNCNHYQLEPLPEYNKVKEFYDKDLQAKSIYSMKNDIDLNTVRKKAKNIERRIKFLRV